MSIKGPNNKTPPPPGGDPLAGLPTDTSSSPSTAPEQGDRFLLAQAGSSNGSSSGPRAMDDAVPRTIDGLIERLVPRGGLSHHRNEVALLLRRAHENLVPRWKPESHPEGKGPTEKQIAKLAVDCLRSAYREVHDENASRSNSEISQYIKPFEAFITVNATAIGLVGTKPKRPRVQGRAVRTNGIPLPERTALAQRILTARTQTVPEMERLAAVIPDSYIVGFVSAQHLPTPETLIEEAQQRAKALAAYGDDAEAIAAKLRGPRQMERALALVEELEEVRDDLRLMRLESTVHPDWKAARHFLGYLRGDIDAWIAQNRDPAVDADLLVRVVESYLAYWFVDQAGNTAARLTHSQEILESALLKVTRDAQLEEHPAYLLRGLGNRLIHYLIRLEARRSRLRLPDDEAPQEAPPLVRTIVDPETLEAAIGEEFIAKIETEYEDIRDGVFPSIPPSIRQSIAVQFFDLVFHYFRYAAYAYGEHLHEEIAARGLEPHFVQAIYRRVENARDYDRLTIEHFRRFFGQQISETVPPVEALLPLPTTAETHAANDAGDGFLPSVDGGMRDYLEPLAVSAKQKESFANEAGIGWESFLQWGTVRANPKHLSAYDWESFVNLLAEADRATQGSELEALLRRTPPAGITADRWQALVAEAAAEGRLVALAKEGAHRPPAIAPEDWARYVALRRERGQLEDVTIEPRMGRSLEAILPAYHVLRRIARQAGRRIDFFDFLCAIYPIARRMRARAVEDAIDVTAPSFMHEQYLYWNWGYSTWAQRVAKLELPTEVVQSTMSSHLRGDTPEYWDVRRYTGPLATATMGGGAEQAAALYEFAAGFLRWMPLIDVMPIFDEDGGLLTNHRPQDIDTRYHFRILYDGIDYRNDVERGVAARQAILTDARLGTYENQLAFIGNYLEALRHLPASLTLTSAHGRSLSLDELLAEYAELEQRQRYARAALRDPQENAALRSRQQLDAHVELFRRIRAFTERVALFTRVRGRIETPRGAISFQAIPTLSGHVIDRDAGAQILLPVGGVNGVAKREQWSPARIAALLQLRILLASAAAEGRLSKESSFTNEAIAAAVGERWSGDDAALAAAIVDLQRLQGEGVLADARALQDTINLVRPTGGRRTHKRVEPFLPRRSSVDWRDQFGRMMQEEGFEPAAIRRGVKIIEAYLARAHAFTRRFWPKTLARIIEELAQDSEQAQRLTEQIVRFLPGIGVANDETPLPENGQIRIERQLAQQAADAYIELFPTDQQLERIPVPIDRALLDAFVVRFVDEHIDRRPNYGLVLSNAQQILERYNQSAGPARWAIAENGSAPRAAGLAPLLLQQAIAAARRQHPGATIDAARMRIASILLLQQLEQGTAIGRVDIERVLARAGEAPIRTDEIDLLDGFLNSTRHSIDLLVQDIHDPEQGIVAFVRNNYRAAYITDEGLQTLATAVVVGRLTGNEPVDLTALSRDVVGDAFAPYRDIADRMAAFYRALLGRWFKARAGQLHDDRQLATMALSEAVDAALEPAASFEEYLAQVAQQMRVPSFAAMEEEAQLGRLFAQMTDRPVETTTIRTAARMVYDKTVQPARAKYERELDELRRAEQTELQEHIDRITALDFQSAELFASFDESPDVKAMLEEETHAFLQRAMQGLETLLGLQDDLSAVTALRTHSERILAELSDDPHTFPLDDGSEVGTLGWMDDRLAAVRKRLDPLDASLTTWIEASEARLKEIAETERREREAAAVAEAIALADARHAAIEETIVSFTQEMLPALEAMRERRTALEEAAPTWHDGHERFAEAVAEADVLLIELTRMEEQLDEYERAILAQRDGRALDDGKAPSLQAIVDRTKELLETEAGKTSEELLWAKERVWNDTAGIGINLGLIAGERTWIAETRDALGALVREAEKALPPAAPLGMPAATTLVDGDMIQQGEMRITFAQWQAPRGTDRRAQQFVDHFLSAQMLNTPEGSWLISTQTASRAKAWLSRARTEPFEVTDLFGNRVRIEARQRGINVVAPPLSTLSHPFALGITRLAGTVANRTSQMALVKELLQAARRSDPARGLIGRLFATLAEPHEEIHSHAALFTRWALAECDAIGSVLKQDIKRFFTVHIDPEQTPHTPAERLAITLPESTILTERALGSFEDYSKQQQRRADLSLTEYGLFAFLNHFPEVRGAVVLDLLLTSSNGVHLQELARFYDHYGELLAAGGRENVPRGMLLKEFHRLHANDAHVELVRRFLSRQVGRLLPEVRSMLEKIGGERRMTVARALTGVDEPWTVAPLLAHLRRAMPESLRIRPEIVEQQLEIYEKLKQVQNIPEEERARLLGQAQFYHDFRRFPEVIGASVLDANIPMIRGTTEEVRDVLRDYGEASEEARAQHASWVERFVRAHTNQNYLRSIRMGLRKRVVSAARKGEKLSADEVAVLSEPIKSFGAQEGDTFASVFMGVETPWAVARGPLLPSSDRSRISEMTLEEIGERLDALDTFVMSDEEVAEIVEEWRASELRALEEGTILQDMASSPAERRRKRNIVVRGLNAFPDIYVRAMIILRIADPTSGLTDRFLEECRTEFDQFIHHPDSQELFITQIAYAFFLDHRVEILEMLGLPTQQPSAASGGDPEGGKTPPGSATPSSSGGATPAPNNGGEHSAAPAGDETMRGASHFAGFADPIEEEEAELTEAQRRLLLEGEADALLDPAAMPEAGGAILATPPAAAPTARPAATPAR